MKYKCATQEGGWIGNLKIILANPHNKQSNVLIKIESNKFNKNTIIKRVREEKNEHNDFTWFGYPRLRPRLQAHPLEDFTIQTSQAFKFL